MKFISFFFLLGIILLVNVYHANGKSNNLPNFQQVDTSKKHPADTYKGRALSQPPVVDTTKHPVDTTKNQKIIKGKKTPAKSNKKSVIVKSDTTKKDDGSLTDEVKAVADSAVSDGADIFYYYGNARVTYTDFELDADYIKVDKKNHLLYAKGSYDAKRHYIGRPISKQKNDAPLISDSLVFNYETKKGRIWNPTTKQGENNITHGQLKKLNETEVAYRNIIFTTCDKVDPDYGIVITRGIGEQKQIIAGPAYLEIEGVPLPIAIPFGFFPKQDTRTSGVLLPTFGEDSRLGFYLRNFGYYIVLSDYADLTNTGTYYTNGSYELNSTLAYLNRYKYSGNLSLSYSAHNYGLPGDPPTKDFNITWSHSQNPNSNPGTTFSASVNAGTSTFYQNNGASQGYNLQALTQNSLRSSIAYGRSWTGFGNTPFNLTVSLSHSQDLTKKTVTLELPTFNFSMSTVSPFDSKTRVGEQKWYQKITIGYNLTGTNRINAVPESQLFQTSTFTKKLQNGLEHQIPIGLNLNVLKYFQFNTSVNYIERWYFQTIREHYARGDSLVTDTVPGFKRVGQYSLSAGLSTKLYGTIQFKDGKIKAIRHVMTPTISFNFSPDYTGPNYSFNKTIVSTATVPYPVTATSYSIFQQAVYGGPSGGRQAGIGFSLDNVVEAKVRPKSTDTSTTLKKVTLLQSLTLSTFYNFAADSFRLSPITFSGHTSFLHDRLNVTFGGTLNPYETRVGDSIMNNHIVRYARSIDRYTFQDGRLPMLTSFNISASASLNPATFNPKPVNQNTTGNTVQGVNTLQNMNPQQAAKLALLNSDPSAYIDFNIPYNISLNYSFTYSNSVTSTSNTNTLMISGDVALTSKWKIQYNTNLDLRAKQLSSATSFGIYRNLHCWDLNIQWLPFGYYKSYNVTLKVNSAILQDLKLSKRSDYTSNQYFSGQ